MFGRATFDPPAPDRPLYVVGDIHGRADLLGALLDQIAAEAGTDTDLVFVGDYTDRGPDSAAVLARLASGADLPGAATFLKGNHEVMLLAFLENPVGGRRWLDHGGVETLRSFDIALTSRSPDADLVAAGPAFRAALGPARVRFLQTLALQFRSGNVLVTHAGAEPRTPIDAQPEKTLLWGTPGFLKRRRKDGIWVAHGHYVRAAPSAAAGRISVDTGAYFSDHLTAAAIADGQVRFLST